MALSIPFATRILPLTKSAFRDLLATSQVEGKLRARCSKYMSPIRDPGIDLEAKIHAAEFLLHPTAPDTAREFGPRFMTFFHHPELIAWIGVLSRGRDLSLMLELIGYEDKLDARIISEYHPEFRDLSFSTPYAAETEPEIRWTKPPHDPDFLRRAMPVLYHDQEMEFTSPHGEWFMNCAASSCDGVFILIGDSRILAVVDKDRYPVNGERVRVMEAARILLYDIPLQERDPFDLRHDDELLGEHVEVTLREKTGICVPREHRLFFWQTYLEGIKPS
ncbi:MAG: hypothetical protein WC551_00345 [Patescibacteria group bacterium]